MNKTLNLKQDPLPGRHLIFFKGDIITFTLTLPWKIKGSAYLRTNIGHAHITRNEIIREINYDEPRLNRDWYDIPMRLIDDTNFQIKVGLSEVGNFLSKCFFIKEGEVNPFWPEGPNTIIKVEPSYTCCANIIYNTFVRQFGPNKGGGGLASPSEEKWTQILDQKGYTVIPPSGTFRDVIKELDFIIGELGCTILQFLPVHPTPTTYGRMGRFGSPYAALSFTDVDPALAVFDPKATPLEQFIELVDAIHERNAKIFMDIAINHTGWAADLHEAHPEWLYRDELGRIEVPGAWGVRWEDLTKLDYKYRDLWQYMAQVFLTWCRRGIDGFRCDAGYMIPVPAWIYIVAQVREQYPDTIFFLEGLGGAVQCTQDILTQANFNWAYSELFQNYDRNQIEYYLPTSIEISKNDGTMVHYAETHDNNRLASRSLAFAKMRTTISALFSNHGAFGFANGVEWYATEKIDVHGSPSLNWGSPINQISHIRRLNLILKGHPAFHELTKMELIERGGGNQVVLLRHHIPSNKKLLVVVNLDDKSPMVASWDEDISGIHESIFTDLLTEKVVKVNRKDNLVTCNLEAGEVLCLSPDRNDLEFILQASKRLSLIPQRSEIQSLKAKVLDIFQFYNGTKDLKEFDINTASLELFKNPIEYCRKINPFNEEPKVIVWEWERDLRREVMVPPDHFLLVKAYVPFRCRILDEEKDINIAHEESLSCENGSFFVLFLPFEVPEDYKEIIIKLSLYTKGSATHVKNKILLLPKPSSIKIKRTFYRTELLNKPLVFLGTNQRGGMMRAHIPWKELHSKYDALLAANLNPDFPEDRRIMFTRCRSWVVFQGYSQEICMNCLDAFSYQGKSQGFWKFNVPSGQGQYVFLTIGMEMIPDENAIRILLYRNPSENNANRLADDKPVRLILRPDIEDRNFHEITKAYLGPEQFWGKVIDIHPDGFDFTPDKYRKLEVKLKGGTFVYEPEWYYMVHRDLEAERGLDPNSDLFSPGYIYAFLKGGEILELTARVLDNDKSKTIKDFGFREKIVNSSIFKDKNECTVEEALIEAIDHFIVKRGSFNTVIAGYPWFLDWGRDSLIFVRGLISSGRTNEVRTILKQFASFEKDGTIPNMIKGNDAGNRDTSDAPLWFFVATCDLINYEGNESFLDDICSCRSIKDILIDMANSMKYGTPNGIKMDHESGLIFSPSHFTWMDTNYPQGTPREGYPIEIQALWHFALCFLDRIDIKDKQGTWKSLAKKVKSSIMEFFWLEKEGYLADCLYAGKDVKAAHAEVDDALRPNQLFAITLGAITNNNICRKILASCEELLIPGAIRSLADRTVKRPLPIYHNNQLLNNPYNPYQGRYIGDEDTKRKPAYHNGTAWTWVFPSFCEAWVKVYGNTSKDTALSLLTSCVRLMTNSGVIGQIPEIIDGDFPHIPRGCDAQAWGISELLRVWYLLSGV
ncbi:MAG: glycogen debranching enzyme N-terminal domain-containing protein [Desulfobacterales bacterium]|nr:glycogen debranching enzyme N-terminal domain-containing protein [Desulfobacterales bacterium]